MMDTNNQSNLPILTIPFRHFADISYALLCIVGRIRNERRLLGYIDQSLTVAVVLRTERSGVRISPGAPNFEVRSSG